jgi:SET domain
MTPDFWTDEQIQQLEFPPMFIERIHEEKRDIESTLLEATATTTNSDLNNRPISREQLQFATCLLNSRALTVLDHENEQHYDDDHENDGSDGTTAATTGPRTKSSSSPPRCCMMIPLFDMINHSSDEFNCYLDVLGDDDDDDVAGDDADNNNNNNNNNNDNSMLLYHAVIADRDIQMGEELLISYGAGSDYSLDLLLHYGFVPKSNPHDVQFLEWLLLEDDDDDEEDYEKLSELLMKQHQEKEEADCTSPRPPTVSIEADVLIEPTILEYRIRMKHALEEFKQQQQQQEED